MGMKSFKDQFEAGFENESEGVAEHVKWVVQIQVCGAIREVIPHTFYDLTDEEDNFMLHSNLSRAVWNHLRS